MNAIQKHIIQIGLTLAIFAIIATSIVAVTEHVTHDKIIENERQALLSAIHALIPEHEYNNAILNDTKTIAANEQLGTHTTTTVYRARFDQDDKAVILSSIAPDGYNGNITMLIAIYHSGDIAGVRIINHKETPGLGDKIEDRKSNWIKQFSGLSLTQPTPQFWTVKKDGGQFDQFTGATITPRAVVKAIKNALDYFHQHRDELFEPTPS